MPKQTLTKDGYELAYYQSGDGSPIGLLHGFPLDHHMWSPQISALSESHQVIAPDLRGLGASTLGEGDGARGIEMADYAADVQAVLDHAGIDEPIILCGFSMGGYVLWQCLWLFPERIRAIVLCDTKATADSAEAAENRVKLAEKVVTAGAGIVAEAMLPKLLAEGTHTSQPAVVQEVDAMIRRADPEAIAAASRGMARRPDVSAELVGYLWPALVLVGAEDAISTPEEMGTIAQTLPNAHYVEIAASGHMTTLEQPEAVNTALQEFLANLPR